MKRVIDADLFSEALTEWGKNNLTEQHTVNKVIERIDKAAVEVPDAEVMIGHEERELESDGLTLHPLVTVFTCGNCMHQVHKGFLFCPGCGRKLHWQQDKES